MRLDMDVNAQFEDTLQLSQRFYRNKTDENTLSQLEKQLDVRNQFESYSMCKKIFSVNFAKHWWSYGYPPFAQEQCCFAGEYQFLRYFFERYQLSSHTCKSNHPFAASNRWWWFLKHHNSLNSHFCFSEIQHRSSIVLTVTISNMFHCKHVCSKLYRQRCASKPDQTGMRIIGSVY